MGIAGADIWYRTQYRGRIVFPDRRSIFFFKTAINFILNIPVLLVLMLWFLFGKVVSFYFGEKCLHFSHGSVFTFWLLGSLPALSGVHMSMIAADNMPS